MMGSFIGRDESITSNTNQSILSTNTNHDNDNNNNSSYDAYRSAATSLSYLNVEYDDILYNVSYFREENQSNIILNTNLNNYIQNATSLCDYDKLIPADIKVLEHIESITIINNDNEKNEFVCVVCTEKNGSNFVKLDPCLHVFHDKCIITWLKYKNTCPVCRAVVQ